ncbi:MAG TPA: purine-nucleoside phosphorylase [Acidobacteriota bacterium]|jgi:purine-nucleoside phosphorylase|nr:purine-nucleoside phosphorylase [Acidobacteriota bacterium]
MLTDPDNYQRRLDEAVHAISKRVSHSPSVGLILGSGLGEVLNSLPGNTSMSYSEIPHFPRSTVVGHSGNLVFNRVARLPFIAMQGRVHYYEGYPMEEVVFPVRVLIKLGIKRLIVTNAAGGVKRKFRPGDLMLIADHINLMATNPLLGPNLDVLGPRFPDMSDAYSRDFRELARAAARKKKIPLQQGVYIGLAGPSYETPAEIRMLARLGGDAVGMSTVPEVIAANHAGVKVLGISCITNMAAGILRKKLDHSEVMATTARVNDKFATLMMGILEKLAQS